MTEAFYAIVIIAFASLGVLTLFTHLVRGTEIRESVAEQGRELEELEDRTEAIRAELVDLKFDTDTMDDERVALEKQASCMLDLERRYRASQEVRSGPDRPGGKG